MLKEERNLKNFIFFFNLYNLKFFVPERIKKKEKTSDKQGKKIKQNIIYKEFTE